MTTLTWRNFERVYKPIDLPNTSTFWTIDEVETAGIPVERVWHVVGKEKLYKEVRPGFGPRGEAHIVTEVPRTNDNTTAWVNLADWKLWEDPL